MKEQPQEQPPVAELDEEACTNTLFGFWNSRKKQMIQVAVLALLSGAEALVPTAASYWHGVHCIQQQLAAGFFGASPPKLNRVVQGLLKLRWSRYLHRLHHSEWRGRLYRDPVWMGDSACQQRVHEAFCLLISMIPIVTSHHHQSIESVGMQKPAKIVQKHPICTI